MASKSKRIVLGPTYSRHVPDYELRAYRDGNPRKRIRSSKVDLRSVVAIQTAKNLTDVAGTFTITLKDSRARHAIREMDVIVIRLAGHYGGGLTTVIKGVVDRSRAAGSADAYAAKEDTVIEGRCVAKYLQVTSLFLPVWDPASNLPTALTFGFGDAARKVGGNRPYDIFAYLVRRFTIGTRRVGVSSIPNARHWLDHKTRFSKSRAFQVPYLQFDENAVSEALKRLEVTGYTEAWVDELGRVVYRHPQWDAPAKYVIDTGELSAWDFDRGDVGTATYVEVIPAGMPGIDAGSAQALMAGRAPIPSSYISAGGGRGVVGDGFVIHTDSKGRVTKRGQRNHWYRMQRRLGVRPQQITSPLLASQEQAQKQAEGLLRFYSRMQKGGSFTIPGCPQLRLGYTCRVHGDLDERRFDRAFYIEGVAHDYVDGEGYRTHVTVTHGRDPWDPRWKQITLPKVDPADLATGTSGVLQPPSFDTGERVPGGRARIRSDGTAVPPANAPAAVANIIAYANRIITKPYGHGAHAVSRTIHSEYDCSSSTAYALLGADLVRPGVNYVSGTFMGMYEPGHGSWVTLYANSGHVFVEVAGIYFNTAHYGSTTPAGSGPRWSYTKQTSSSYGRFAIRHPRGL